MSIYLSVLIIGSFFMDNINVDEKYEMLNTTSGRKKKRGCPFETASDILYNRFLLNRMPVSGS
jgi:hypothetical protein